YAGTVHFNSSDGLAVLPANYTFVAGDNGVHAFTVTLKKAGNQTVTVSDASATSINGSAAVTVTAASPDHLGFGQQPTNAAAGSALSPAVAVQVLDLYGNLVALDQTDAVSLALGTNAAGGTPGGGTLSGTLTVTAQNGLASFSSLSISTPGTGYTLAAASGSLAGATSGTFNVTQAGTHLFFGQQPTSTVAGSAISPAVTVQ